MNKPKVKTKNDLTPRLRSLIRSKKVGVFVDAGNLYHTASMAGMHIDFEQFINWFKTYTRKVKVNFYTAYNPEDEKQAEFLRDLRSYGYDIVKKPIKIFENSKKGNMDIELAVDALKQKEEYDIFVLVSGDGDFHYLMKELEESAGKKTVIMSVGGFTSYDLHQDAGNYFFLDRINEVWQSKDNKQKNKYVIFVDQFEYPTEIFKESQKTEPEKKPFGSQQNNPKKKQITTKSKNKIIQKTEQSPQTKKAFPGVEKSSPRTKISPKKPTQKTK